MRQRRLTKTEVSDIIVECKSGEPAVVRQMAERYGCTVQAIYRHLRKSKTRERRTVPTPKAGGAVILNQKVSEKVGEPVWSLQEWLKHFPQRGPREALKAKISRCDWQEDGPATEKPPQFRTYPLYLRNLCTECKGDGSERDPMIVGCRTYECECWPFRFGKNPYRQQLGRKAQV